MCTVSLNNELNGVELYFNSKPETEILANLKTIGFRWHKIKKCWYAKQNERTMAIANKFSDSKIDSKNDTVIAEKEEFYFPNYSKVGNVDVLRESNLTIFDFRYGYYADINAYVYFYNNSATIIDLSNAMKTGKTCTKYHIAQAEWKDNDFCTFYNLITSNGIKTVNEFYQAVIENRELNGLTISKSEKKSIDVFSPFVKVKPIKTPTKWTRTHVWKAILSGQIFRGETNYHYTDDYALDAAYNYCEGCGVDLIDLAQDIIESSCSGFTVYAGEETDGIVPVSFHTYSYDCKTLYFDEKCDNEKKIKKLEQIKNDKENHNRKLKEKVIPLKESDLNQNMLYEIEQLEMNDNTGMYKVVKDTIHARGLFYEGESNYLVISINPFEIDNHSLYCVDCEVTDKRLIDIGERGKLISGYALQEMLIEGTYFSDVSKSGFTFETAKEQCQKFMNGTMTYLFCEDKTDYPKAILQLNSEELRIPEDDVLCLTL